MPRMMLRGLFLGVLCLLMHISICAAEDMRFVDADGDTGYYVDSTSIVHISDIERDATVAVIKAAECRSYIYHVRFNRQASTYQIFSMQVEVYGTHEVLRNMQTVQQPQPYGLTSPMQSIVDFIEELLLEKQQMAKESS